MRGINLKEAVKTQGVRKVYRTFKECLQAPETDPKHLNPDDFSFQELWESMVGDMKDTLPFAMAGGRSGYLDEELLETPLREAPLDTTGFPTITGLLISSKVLEGYNQPQFIGKGLTTNIPSKHVSERMAGFGEPENVEEVKEGGEYQESDLGERFVTTEATKKGRLISVTEEMVYFDQTGQVLARAAKLGGRAALDKDKSILKGILEGAAADYCYRPSGSETAIYTTAKKTLYLNNELVDYTDIENAEDYLGDQTDDKGEAIVTLANAILVANAKVFTARRVINATEVSYEGPAMALPSDSIVTKGSNPVKKVPIFSSPLVHQLLVAAGIAAATAKKTWWYGDFKGQFYWQEIWPIQTFRRKMKETDTGFTRDIVAQFKVRHYGGVFAGGDKYVVKSTP